MTQPEGLAFRNPVKRQGWAQVYHVLTLDTDLSDGAFRLYVLLLRYARQDNGCWPGRDRLAHDLGKSTRTVDYRLEELVRRGLVTREQRQNQTAMTWIEDVERVYHPVPARNCEDVPAKNCEDLSLQNLADKEETEEETGMKGGDGLTTRQRQSMHLLSGFGVTDSVARDLAQDCDPESVRAWITYTEHAQGLHNPAAFVVSKLKAGDPIPENGKDPADDRKRYLEWVRG
jgi:hypothetical protein